MTAITAGSDAASPPSTRAARILTVDDLRGALRQGWDDFAAKPTHVLFLVAIYPLAGLLLATLAGRGDALALVFPLVAGFALLGPLTAVGLYELSRRREAGEPARLADAVSVATGPAAGPVARIALVLFAIFTAWLTAADLLWASVMGVGRPESVSALSAQVFGTTEGLRLIVLGHLVGGVFAAAALAVSMFSLPMVVAGERSAFAAMRASIQTVAANPRVCAIWGLVVGAIMAVASAPFLIGLAVALPVLGHATWRLYRRAWPD
ncbi:MAG: DUF2189 domain-containing protein [Rubrimonas sp.]|uniref:DUF2189 domain-containing protein n=1 Tax=Rubrimonas sp. TaxID=2036015 RepID=UPI002FDF08C5